MSINFPRLTDILKPSLSLDKLSNHCYSAVFKIYYEHAIKMINFKTDVHLVRDLNIYGRKWLDSARPVDIESLHCYNLYYLKSVILISYCSISNYCNEAQRTCQPYCWSKIICSQESLRYCSNVNSQNSRLEYPCVRFQGQYGPSPDLKINYKRKNNSTELRNIYLGQAVCSQLF